MNIILNGFVCPNCFNKIHTDKNEVLKDAFTYDNSRQELYCNKCGLVVRDPSIPTLNNLEYLSIRDSEFKSTELYDRIAKEKKFIDAYDFTIYKRAILKAEEEAKEKERIRKREERKAKAKATRERNKKKKKKKKKG